MDMPTLYAAIIWTGLSALYPLHHRVSVSRLLRGLAIAALVMVSATIVAGGFTAGLHAGLAYNTFPLMEGSIVPDGYTMLSPLIRNFTENVAAVQFDHRLLATATLILVSTLATAGWRAGLPRPFMACLVAAVLECATIDRDNECDSAGTMLSPPPPTLEAAAANGQGIAPEFTLRFTCGYAR